MAIIRKNSFPSSVVKKSLETWFKTQANFLFLNLPGDIVWLIGIESTSIKAPESNQDGTLFPANHFPLEDHFSRQACLCCQHVSPLYIEDL